MASSGSPRLPPVVVHHRTYSSSSPRSSTPVSPSSPRNVHFLPAMSPVSGVTRPLNKQEAWSLYYFEKHAENCRSCYDPEYVFNHGRHLCEVGHDLARDALLHVRMVDGVVYSTREENQTSVRVEILPDYRHTRGLLRAMERKRRKAAAANTMPAPATVTAAPILVPMSPTKPARDTRTDSVMGRVGAVEDDDRRTKYRRRSADVTVEQPKSSKQQSRSKERRDGDDTKRSERRRRETNSKTADDKNMRIEIRLPERTKERTKVYYY